MSESKKSSDHVSALARLIFGAAKDEGMEREVADALWTAHQQNSGGKKHKPFASLPPETGKIIKGTIRRSNQAARKVFKDGGFVDFTQQAADPEIQTLAEATSRLVDKEIHENLPEVKARRTLAQIIQEIIDRNGW